MKTIMLSRDLGIKKAGKFYRAAIAVMEATPDCALDFSRVERLDLSAAQVALALRCECERRGGRFIIRNTNDATSHLLRLAGIKGV